MKAHLLIDGDALIYRAAAAVERAVNFGGGVWAAWGDVNEALIKIEADIDRMLINLGAADYTLCLSHARNWRRELAPSYKANRASTRPPVVLAALREEVERLFPCRSMPRLEADDVMGVLATEPLVKQTRIVVSPDKDLRQIPGLVCRTLDPENAGDIATVSRAEADDWHMAQALAGDRTDGYAGCPGIGAVKAGRLVAQAREKGKAPWPDVVAAYVKAGLTADDALLNARLARILRHDDYDQETEEVTLWSPHTH